MMKQIPRVLLAALAVLSLVLNPQPAQAAVPSHDEILGEAAVLMDLETGQILYEKNPGKRMYPASITKIMTGLLVMENLDPGQVVTASEKAVDIPYWGASAYITEGERMTVDQAMYAMMLRSANEAANILAEEVAGSLEGFAEQMTRRAEELGAQGTRFTNANGLPERNHYTTARDMALITRQAVQTPGFLDYFGKDSYTMAATNKAGIRIFTNTHRMLVEGYWQYNEEVIGGKTGYTSQSGYTLVTVAEREGRSLICVILKSPSYYVDTTALLEYGFGEFTPYTYAFRQDGPLRSGLWEEGREAGEAYFYPPSPAELLLHESVDPGDLVEEYQAPQRLEVGGPVEGSAEIRLTREGAEGLPLVLLSLPMEVEIAPLPPPEEPAGESAAEVGGKGEPPFSLWDQWPVVAVGTFIAGCMAVALLAFGVRRVRARRRRKTKRLLHPVVRGAWRRRNAS